MIKNIKNWIFRIKEYNKLETSFYELIYILSWGEYKKWDNAMETIEAYQSRKYLLEHKEDVMTILTENMDDPEESARQLLEYFEIIVNKNVNWKGNINFSFE
jgi:hypothetical protein